VKAVLFDVDGKTAAETPAAGTQVGTMTEVEAAKKAYVDEQAEHKMKLVTTEEIVLGVVPAQTEHPAIPVMAGEVEPKVQLTHEFVPTSPYPAEHRVHVVAVPARHQETKAVHVTPPVVAAVW